MPYDGGFDSIRMVKMKILGVRFRETGKIYYYLCKENNIKSGDKIIAETKLGLEAGTVLSVNVSENKKDFPNEYIIRKATPEDIKVLESKRKDELRALKICKKKVIAHKLKMKLIDAEYVFDRSKLVFYFVAESRVDFRNLVKELAYIFKVRIELRQIGIRDEAKMLGGFGICGREFCCGTFLNDFQSVSIKMAKDQDLSMNPVKLSGACGRLMCCLKYEQDAYKHILHKMPKVGKTVKVSPLESGTVKNLNVLKEIIEVEVQTGADTSEIRKITLSEFEKLN